MYDVSDTPKIVLSLERSHCIDCQVKKKPKQSIRYIEIKRIIIHNTYLEYVK